MKEIRLKIDGMMCGMCEAHINDTVRKFAGVKKVTSSHTKGETVIIVEDGKKLDTEALKASIKDTGYTVTDVTEGEYKKRGLFSAFGK